MIKIVLTFYFIFISFFSFSQAITTTVPFLNVSPDARSSSLGNTGVATSDIYGASFWNPSKYSSTDEIGAVMFSNIPKMSNISNMTMSYLSGFYKTSRYDAIAMSLRYFNQDNMTYANSTGTILGKYSPVDFSIDVSYAKRLSRYYNIGITARYIHSSLSDNNDKLGFPALKGNAFAVDISMFWSNSDLTFLGNPTTFNWGVNISNLGTKMIYNGLYNNNFLPSNLKYGISVIQKIDRLSRLNFSAELNKLLVPTPDPENPNYSSNMSLMQGVWNSLTYAPGGFSEKVREIIWSVGLEYEYDDLVAFRAGYHFDHPDKGNAQFVSFGGGVALGMLILDTSYSIPIGRSSSKSGNIFQLSMIVRSTDVYRKKMKRFY